MLVKLCAAHNGTLCICKFYTSYYVRIVEDTNI